MSTTGTVTPDLADAEARRAICEDTHRTLFVAAGAGSGKTTALVQRILTLALRDGVGIEQIAAVTFTERAAEDLRDKIRHQLESAETDAVRAGDEERARRARAALESLDLAAIGTLHSFAQRILTQHCIAAGIPPAVHVLDQIASSVAAQTQWRALWTELLEDDAMAETLDLALELGVTRTHLRDLMGRLTADWDLVVTHVPPATSGPLRLPDVHDLARRAELLSGLLPECRDGGDNFARFLEALVPWAAEASSGSLTDARSVLAWLDRLPTWRKNSGAAKNWARGFDLTGAKAEGAALKDDVAAAQGAIMDAVLRRLTEWLAARVVAAAQSRRAAGELTFQDLLVLSRDLLRRDPEVRADLQSRYPRVLLDEFQDTDPLQIEIAARIAGGAAADQERWQEIDIPAGSLFVVGDPKQSIYRFRRADISLYLEAQRVLGGRTSLTTSFRSLEPVIDWVNSVFEQVIVESEGAQPAYEALDASRGRPASGPGVAVIGVDGHLAETGKAASIDDVREIEARDIVGTVRAALAEGWVVTEKRRDGEEERRVRLGDITLLVPTRTPLGVLEGALDEAGIPYRTEATSLVHAAPEVRGLLTCARAIADPTDAFTLVTALRSPLFGIDDRELSEHRAAGGSFDLRVPAPAGREGTQVARALAELNDLHRESIRLAPSELLGRIAERRRLFELGAGSGPRARDTWRRLRYVIEQARAWTDTERGGLRGYLDWALAQADAGEQAAESVLPETDTDGLRITTVHAAKGLDFPVVILAGLGTEESDRGGVKLLWGEGDYGVWVRKEGGLFTAGAEERREREQEMEHAERARLLYVGATRARDHLVVSLHRRHGSEKNSAHRIHEAQGAADGITRLSFPEQVRLPERSHERATPPPAHEEWEARIRAARANSARPWSRSASVLEGTDPVTGEGTSESAPMAAGRAASAADAPTGEVDSGAPPARAGRGRLVGDAVHGALHVLPFDAAADVMGAVRSQCRIQGIEDLEPLVARLVRSALEHPLLAAAEAAPRHLRETYVGAPAADAPDEVRDGIVDLLVEEGDGTLTVIDYKTDAAVDSALATRAAHYAPQLREYRRLVEATTGRRVGRCVLLFLAEGGAQALEIDAALDAAVEAGPADGARAAVCEAPVIGTTGARSSDREDPGSRDPDAPVG